MADLGSTSRKGCWVGLFFGGIDMCYVYVLSDDEENHERPRDGVRMIKIGHTQGADIDSRVKQLQTGNPRPLRIIEVFEFQNIEMAKQVEKLLHWNLKESRKIGEWFEYGDETIETLSRMAFLSNHYPRRRMREFYKKNGIV